MIAPEAFADGHFYDGTRVNSPCAGCSTVGLLVLTCEFDDE